MCIFPAASPIRIAFTASSTVTRPGMAKSFFRVRGVSTKPGETTVTVIPFGSQSRRRLSANQLSAALDAP